MRKLFTPGPVEIPQEVAEASARQPLHHRSQEFQTLSHRVWKNLQTVFRTTGPVAVLGGSGMSGIEACLTSLFRPAETILVLNNGRFGERITTMGRIHGVNVIEIVAPWGSSIDAAAVGEVLSQNKNVRGIWFVHSETSTGVLIDARAIAAIARSVIPEILICVDAVTSIAIHEFETSQWDIDVAVAGIQKGLMCPPGLSCCALSIRALDRVITDVPQTYTLNLQTVLSHHDRGLFAWTPPVSLVAALDVALSLIKDEGLDSVWLRHATVAHALRERLVAHGSNLFGNATSNALVAVEDVRADEIKKRLHDRHGIVIAGGQDALSGRIFRIGTCGSVVLQDVDDFFVAFADVTADL